MNLDAPKKDQEIKEEALIKTEDRTSENILDLANKLVEKMQKIEQKLKKEKDPEKNKKLIKELEKLAIAFNKL